MAHEIPWSIIKSKSRSIFRGLDDFLIAAIIKTESSGDMYAIRYEPAFKYRKEVGRYSKLNNISEETESVLQSCSFGLMQVMGCVARECGFDDNLVKLIEPSINIEVGTKKIVQLFSKYKNLPDTISCYNRGSILLDKDGKYKNQNYVDKVLAAYEEFKSKRAQ